MGACCCCKSVDSDLIVALNAGPCFGLEARPLSGFARRFVRVEYPANSVVWQTGDPLSFSVIDRGEVRLVFDVVSTLPNEMWKSSPAASLGSSSALNGLRSGSMTPSASDCSFDSSGLIHRSPSTTSSIIISKREGDCFGFPLEMALPVFDSSGSSSDSTHEGTFHERTPDSVDESSPGPRSQLTPKSALKNTDDGSPSSVGSSNQSSTPLTSQYTVTAIVDTVLWQIPPQVDSSFPDSALNIFSLIHSTPTFEKVISLHSSFIESILTGSAVSPTDLAPSDLTGGPQSLSAAESAKGLATPASGKSGSHLSMKKPRHLKVASDSGNEISEHGLSGAMHSHQQIMQLVSRDLHYIRLVNALILSSLFKFRLLREGEVLFKEGSVEQSFYVVAKGTVLAVSNKVIDEAVVDDDHIDGDGGHSGRSHAVTFSKEGQKDDDPKHADHHEGPPQTASVTDWVTESKHARLSSHEANVKLEFYTGDTMHSLPENERRALMIGGTNLRKDSAKSGGSESDTNDEGSALDSSSDLRSKERIMAKISDGGSFGEIALVQRMPRTATIRGLTDTLLLELNKRDFRKYRGFEYGVFYNVIMEQLKSQANETMAESFRKYKIPLFKAVPLDKFYLLSKRATVKHYKKGEYIVGGPNGINVTKRALYVIAHGEVGVFVMKKTMADGPLSAAAVANEGMTSEHTGMMDSNKRKSLADALEKSVEDSLFPKSPPKSTNVTPTQTLPAQSKLIIVTTSKSASVSEVDSDEYRSDSGSPASLEAELVGNGTDLVSKTSSMVTQTRGTHTASDSPGSPPSSQVESATKSSAVIQATGASVPSSVRSSGKRNSKLDRMKSDTAFSIDGNILENLWNEEVMSVAGSEAAESVVSGGAVGSGVSGGGSSPASAMASPSSRAGSTKDDGSPLGLSERRSGGKKRSSFGSLPGTLLSGPRKSHSRSIHEHPSGQVSAALPAVPVIYEDDEIHDDEKMDQPTLKATGMTGNLGSGSTISLSDEVEEDDDCPLRSIAGGSKGSVIGGSSHSHQSNYSHVSFRSHHKRDQSDASQQSVGSVMSTLSTISVASTASHVLPLSSFKSIKRGKRKQGKATANLARFTFLSSVSQAGEDFQSSKRRKIDTHEAIKHGLLTESPRAKAAAIATGDYPETLKLEEVARERRKRTRTGSGATERPGLENVTSEPVPTEYDRPSVLKSKKSGESSAPTQQISTPMPSISTALASHTAALPRIAVTPFEEKSAVDSLLSSPLGSEPEDILSPLVTIAQPTGITGPTLSSETPGHCQSFSDVPLDHPQIGGSNGRRTDSTLDPLSLDLLHSHVSIGQRGSLTPMHMPSHHSADRLDELMKGGFPDLDSAMRSAADPEFEESREFSVSDSEAELRVDRKVFRAPLQRSNDGSKTFLPGMRTDSSESLMRPLLRVGSGSMARRMSMPTTDAEMKITSSRERQSSVLTLFEAKGDSQLVSLQTLLKKKEETSRIMRKRGGRGGRSVLHSRRNSKVVVHTVNAAALNDYVSAGHDRRDSGTTDISEAATIDTVDDAAIYGHLDGGAGIGGSSMMDPKSPGVESDADTTARDARIAALAMRKFVNDQSDPIKAKKDASGATGAVESKEGQPTWGSSAGQGSPPASSGTSKSGAIAVAAAAPMVGGIAKKTGIPMIAVNGVNVMNPMEHLVEIEVSMLSVGNWFGESTLADSDDEDEEEDDEEGDHREGVEIEESDLDTDSENDDSTAVPEISPRDEGLLERVDSGHASPAKGASKLPMMTMSPSQPVTHNEKKRAPSRTLSALLDSATLDPQPAPIGGTRSSSGMKKGTMFGLSLSDLTGGSDLLNQSHGEGATDGTRSASISPRPSKHVRDVLNMKRKKTKKRLLKEDKKIRYKGSHPSFRVCSDFCVIFEIDKKACDAFFKDVPEAHQWFEVMLSKYSMSLEVVLKIPQATEAFLYFLESEFAEENLQFVLTVNDFKKMFGASNEETRLELATLICETFVSSSAEQQVNLAGMRQRALMKIVESQNPKLITQDMFDAALRSIYLLLERDCFPRFKQSRHFQEFLELVETFTMTTKEEWKAKAEKERLKIENHNLRRISVLGSTSVGNNNHPHHHSGVIPSTSHGLKIGVKRSPLFGSSSPVPPPPSPSSSTRKAGNEGQSGFSGAQSMGAALTGPSSRASTLFGLNRNRARTAT